MEFSHTGQTISWFRDRYRNGELIIKPAYQRKPVWVARQKCYLIESILLGLPIPEIYIQITTTPEGESTYAIVDGQQRIRTILQFIGFEVDPEEQDYIKFALEKLPLTSEWKNFTFAELSDEIKKKFYEYIIAIRYLKTESDEEVRDMFRRLNKFLTPLKPQELRNATYNGPFVELVLKLADNEYWAINGIVTASAIRRMTDVEFVSELLIGVMHGPQGGSSKIIDQYYSQYEDYDDEFPEQKRISKFFEETLETIKLILPEIDKTRWSNKTDFYSLFVAIASLIRLTDLPENQIRPLRKVLIDLEGEIDKCFSGEDVSQSVEDYVHAVEKGANDKNRRAVRHETLLQVITPFFKPKRLIR